MASKRKTVKVSELVAKVNRFNSLSTLPADIRNGWNGLLESILHETGNYRGFGYYEAKDVPAGQLPGIIPTLTPDGGYASGPHQFPDESRRFYYSR